jgi:cysteine desulfurase/selenocysteine lyase
VNNAKFLNFQKQFARKPGLIHLNNAGLAPISLAARDKVQYWAERFYQEGFLTDAVYIKVVQ